MTKTPVDHLINTITKHNPQANLDLIRRAYTFADAAHEGQWRFNGEPYLNHVVATAQLLADWQLSDTIVAAGLLHDAPEDTNKTIADVTREFGAEIASIVEGETKLGRAKHIGMDRYVENLRKLFLAMVHDVRVIFVKFADRIHNLSTIEALPLDKKYRTARESLEIYAPIAGRLGMGEIKGLLEDMSFPHVYPKEYEWVKTIAIDKIKQKGEHAKEVQKILEEELQQAGIPYQTVHGRAKHLYSLYKKLLKHDRDIARIYDIVAVRVIVKDVAACYATLGLIHHHWTPLQGRIKDYIAQPKPNGYRSLHTTIFDDDGEVVEFQIRTTDMHEEDEYGIAAHWRYDESGKRAATHRKLKWMEELAKIHREIEDKKKFMNTLEELKIDLFQNRVFVSTPQGDVLDLPEDSTPVDFAYAVHTDIGNHCIGAEVNTKPAPLDTKLYSGDVVKIVVNPKRKGPALEWLKFTKTRHARERIRIFQRKNFTGWIHTIIQNSKK